MAQQNPPAKQSTIANEVLAQQGQMQQTPQPKVEVAPIQSTPANNVVQTQGNNVSGSVVVKLMLKQISINLLTKD